MTSIKSRLTHNSSLIFRIIILLMAIFNFEMLQCCVITGTGCHRGHHISGLTGCCAIVYMGAAILEQQEQLAYKESFPTTYCNVSSQRNNLIKLIHNMYDETNERTHKSAVFSLCPGIVYVKSRLLKS